MASIAIRLRDPAGEYWAQLVNPAHTVGQMTSVLVDRLGLPRHLSYELAPDDGGVALPAGMSLAQLGIQAGANLAIRPVRSDFFERFLKELYDEAVSYVRDEVWDLAKERLETVYRLDPKYPDSERLRPQLETVEASGKTRGYGPSRETEEAPPPSRPTSQTALPPPPIPEEEAAESEPVDDLEPPPQFEETRSWGREDANADYRDTLRRRPSAIGMVASLFSRLVLLAFVVLLGGSALLYFRVIPAPDWLPEWFPLQDSAGTITVNGVEVGTGDIRVTLTWDSDADLDLYVTDPAGEEIYFREPEAASGGRLDVDAHANCVAGPAVENIFWPEDDAPSGDYAIRIDQFLPCGATVTEYAVEVAVDGRTVDRHTGTLASSDDGVELPGFTR